MRAAHELKTGAGVGARWNSPIGPLTVTIGWKLRRDANESASPVLCQEVWNPEALEENIGLDVVEKLKGLTDSLYQSVDHALASAKENFSRLTHELGHHFQAGKLLPGDALQQVDAYWEKTRSQLAPEPDRTDGT